MYPHTGSDSRQLLKDFDKILKIQILVDTIMITDICVIFKNIFDADSFSKNLS